MRLASILHSFPLIDLLAVGHCLFVPTSFKSSVSDIITLEARDSSFSSIVRRNSPANSSQQLKSTHDFEGQFWAGACIGTLLREEAIPGRVYYDYDGQTTKDPIETLSDAGVNVIRVEASRGQCLGPSHFVNNASTRQEELTFTLDWGCIDTQVETARRSVAQGMRVVLTINQGFNIPEELEQLSYTQMVENVQNETKRQLQPFLDAKIVPDIILLENEGTDGFLFNETSTGHIRGVNDGKASIDTVNKELCGLIPTGNMASWPQIAGYYKAEIIAANEALDAAGFSPATVRYGLHSHGQYVQWKEGIVHGPNTPSESKLVDTTGSTCSNGDSIIPDFILARNVSQMLTIAGFSAYPDPMTPTDIYSASSEAATLTRLNATLTQLQGYAEAYGKFTTGPFAGQFKLQSLGVEYATAYTYVQVPQEIAETELMWKLVKSFGSFLGMMWWEPWYCYNDWEGGRGTLSRSIGSNGEAPTDVLKTWGAEAISPWKSTSAEAS